MERDWEKMSALVHIHVVDGYRQRGGGDNPSLQPESVKGQKHGSEI